MSETEQIGPTFHTIMAGGEAYKVISYPPPDPFYSIMIPSSDPSKEPYCVLVDKKSVECNCPAFTYRHSCRHVTLAVKVIRESAK